METLPVLTIEITGWVTSFRYPYFTQGYQPTFEMPPPSTIYGHLSSAIGDYLPKDGWRFGYRFTHSGRFIDYMEHLHFEVPDIDKQLKPVNRELLFKPNLLLYIHHPDMAQLNALGNALIHPYYAVNLGRSQDLMTYSNIQLRQLHRAEVGYYEHTLLPLRYSTFLNQRMIPVTMPRYIDPRRRQVQNTPYVMLTGIAVFPPAPPEADEDEDENERMMLTFETEVNRAKQYLWIDPQSPHHNKYPTHQRAIYLHSFDGEE
ncbi:MAG: CRISPR-associated protein Cas5 [Anaerolineae bacterium]|jgi:CRISPR-associated protein Cas5t|nr:CRISPR-associated protein Cas5 [Anaerolineae bacterium]